jgi:hypothetical protein
MDSSPDGPFVPSSIPSWYSSKIELANFAVEMRSTLAKVLTQTGLCAPNSIDLSALPETPLQERRVFLHWFPHQCLNMTDTYCLQGFDAEMQTFFSLFTRFKAEKDNGQELCVSLISPVKSRLLTYIVVK